MQNKQVSSRKDVVLGFLSGLFLSIVCSWLSIPLGLGLSTLLAGSSNPKSLWMLPLVFLAGMAGIGIPFLSAKSVSTGKKKGLIISISLGLMLYSTCWGVLLLRG